MAVDRYYGKSCGFAINAITASFAEFGVDVTSVKGEATAANSTVVQRGTKQIDAKITMKGWNGPAHSFKEIAALVNSNTPLSAITYDAAGSTNLPSSFFTDFPLAKWKVDDVSTNQTDDASQWTATLSANNLDFS